MTRRVLAGDIGEPLRHIELEPIEAPAVPAGPVPTLPAPTPAPEPQVVPA